MRVLLVVCVAIAIGCGGGSITPTFDGGLMSPDAQPDATEPGGFFGEHCVDDPPANTVCHSGAGWCIVDVCRPMCSEDVRRCPEGVVHFAPAGACYCAPS